MLNVHGIPILNGAEFECHTSQFSRKIFDFIRVHALGSALTLQGSQNEYNTTNLTVNLWRLSSPLDL